MSPSSKKGFTLIRYPAKDLTFARLLPALSRLGFQKKKLVEESPDSIEQLTGEIPGVS